MPTTGAAIEFDGLALRFGHTTVLHDFDLELAPGQTAVLSGPSGCGKSSLLHCLLGFLQPTAGQVRVDHTAVTGQSVWHVRRQLAWVPQEPQLGQATAADWVDELLAFAANADARAQRDRLTPELDALGLDETVLAKGGEEISGGEKQRLALAFALLLDRPALLLDEPTSALDAVSRDRVYDRLRRLTDTTVLMISHDRHPNLDFADDVVTLTPPEAARGSD